MSVSTTGLFNKHVRSPWVANQAVSSAAMVEKMVHHDLRHGNLADLEARISRIDELVKEHLLEPEVERSLLLLAARLLDAAGHSRRVNRIVGQLISDDARLKEPFLSELRRFRGRLALNRGDFAAARYEVERADRTVTETPEAFGQVKEHVDREDESAVTAQTWLLSAEVGIAEGDLSRAIDDLAKAFAWMKTNRQSPDEAAMFELLSALVRVGTGDDEGAPAIAYLYGLHALQRKDSPVEAATIARIAAAAGDFSNTICICEAEARRWRGYGPDPELVRSYLRQGQPLRPPSSILNKLPAVDEFMKALDERFPSGERRAEPPPAAGREHEEEKFSSWPLSFLFADHTLHDVTSMFDNALKTGPLVVEWSACDGAAIREAIEGGAISEIAGRVSSGTIYFNNGAYVDARFNAADPAVLSLSPVDVITELFRIAMAGLPGAGARQFETGPGVARIPELISMRPNKLNLDIVRRFDELRRGFVEAQEEEGDLDAAFANWGGSAAAQSLPRDDETTVVRETGAPGEQFHESVVAAGRDEECDGGEAEVKETGVAESAQTVSMSPSSPMFSSLLEVLQAMSLRGLCQAVSDSLVALGLPEPRLEVTRLGSVRPLVEFGPVYVDPVKSDYPAGPLMIGVGFPGDAVSGSGPAVAFVLGAAAQRLRSIPGGICKAPVELSGFVAEDPLTQGLLSEVRDLAQLDGTSQRQKLKHILIVGERGTGKELIAKAIHQWSRRCEKNFRVVNLGAISKELASAEIFGSKKGAFTSAVADRNGYIQDSEGGTLFLDEIDEADEPTQAMLKRVVQFGTYNVVGSPEEQTGDVRFVAATNRVFSDIPFIKEDLRDRFLEIKVPALRERRGDIRPLAEFFAAQFEYTLPGPVLDYLESLDWPGNIRQLQNTVERVCALANSPADLNLDAFERAVGEAGASLSGSGLADGSVRPLEPGETMKMRLRRVSRELIELYLRMTDGNRKRTAEMLGITRAGLHDRMRELLIQDVKD